MGSAGEAESVIQGMNGSFIQDVRTEAKLPNAPGSTPAPSLPNWQAPAPAGTGSGTGGGIVLPGAAWAAAAARASSATVGQPRVVASASGGVKLNPSVMAKFVGGG